ncbi:MAG: hypothetical protein M3R24_12830 [Chloroflexota bacterium]|nr:hypothetical protein [Chloroflexota bacterium]
MGLDENASVEDVESKFRVLAKAMHPDVGGNNHEMQSLLKARDVALSVATDRNNLLPISLVRDIVRASNEAVLSKHEALIQRQESYIARQEAKTVARELSRQISQRATSSLRHMREMSIVMAAVSTAAFFAGQNLPSALISTYGVSERTLTMLPLIFIVVGLVFATYTWLIQQRIRRTEQAVEDLTVFLSSAANYIGFLLAIRPAAISEPWTSDILEQDIQEWQGRTSADQHGWRHIVAQLGSADFARLLIAKGIELGLLNGQLVNEYDHYQEKFVLRLPVE